MDSPDQLKEAQQGRIVRRNIHTYPFKYSYTQASEFFAPQQAAIYIHIPFCSTKCHFCDYTVYVNTKEDLQRQYLAALETEIRSFNRMTGQPPFTIDAIYFGGGTPGLLSATDILRLVKACKDTFPFVASPEICVEFDPQCATFDKLNELRDNGVTRISIGVQTFDDNLLKENNRPHNREQIYHAVDDVKKAGYEFFNIDLIYPLLGLEMDGWRASLKEAIALEPGCITAYPLEVWPHTAYHKWIVANGRKLPENAEEVAMAETAFDLLEGAGFQRGSCSGYFHPSRTQEYCRFLTYYWRTLPMLGFGVSSKSVVGDRLYTNINPLKEYVSRVQNGEHPIDFSARLTKEQEMRRVIIRGLKVGDVSKADFAQRFGVGLDLLFGEQLKGLVKLGYLEETEASYSMSRKGQIFSNNVWELFYAADDLSAPDKNQIRYGISELILN